MAYPAAHHVLQIGGPLGATPTTTSGEEWTCSMRFISDAVTELDSMQAAEDLAGKFDTFWRSGQTGCSDAARLSFLKWNRVGPDGKYASDGRTNTVEIAPPNGVGAVAAQQTQHPFQVSAALSLGTARVRGLGCRGRIYLPSPSAPVRSDTGLVEASWADRVGLAWKNFFDGLAVNLPGTALGAGMRLVVGSKGSKDGRPGVLEPVTRVSMGQRLDVVRSRATDLRENYVWHDFGAV